jgi:hypothetical protein
VGDGVYVSYLPNNAAQTAGLSIPLAHLHGRRREIGGNDLLGHLRLLGEPAGETTATTTDLQHALVYKVCGRNIGLDQPVPGSIGLNVYRIAGMPLVVGIDWGGRISYSG